VIGPVIPSIKGLVVGGDFNTNHDQVMFAAEKTLDILKSAGYQSVFEGIAFEQLQQASRASRNGKSIDFVVCDKVDPTASNDAGVPFSCSGHLFVRPAT